METGFLTLPLMKEKLTFWVNVQFLGRRAGMYRLIEMQRLSRLIYAGISIIHDIIHKLLCLHFLDERNNSKHYITFESISVLE